MEIVCLPATGKPVIAPQPTPRTVIRKILKSAVNLCRQTGWCILSRERGHQDLDCKQALGDKGRRALKNPYRYVVGKQCTVFVSWHL